MNIDEELKKDGIFVIKPLDTLSVTLIAKFVAEKFTSYFPFYNLKYNDLFIKVSRIPMYVANIPDGMADANYFYKNCSIYFRDGLDIDKMKELAIHEFIHHYQELKDSKNVLYRLGLCDYTKVKVKGMALNEASVQLLASKMLKKEVDSVKYYGIEINTISPTYYPIICSLVNQMAYITGEDVLIDSTLNSNDKFKLSFINLCGEKVFNKVQNNLDKILKAEENIISTTLKIQSSDINDDLIAKASNKISNCKEVIKSTYINTQNMILTSYFNNRLSHLYSIQDIEDYRKKLYEYKDLIGITEGNTFFNDYYINCMSNLDTIYESITNNTSIVVYKRSIFDILFSKIRKLFTSNSSEFEDVKL